MRSTPSATHFSFSNGNGKCAPPQTAQAVTVAVAVLHLVSAPAWLLWMYGWLVCAFGRGSYNL